MAKSLREPRDLDAGIGFCEGNGHKRGECLVNWIVDQMEQHVPTEFFAIACHITLACSMLTQSDDSCTDSPGVEQGSQSLKSMFETVSSPIAQFASQ
eukprot:4303212-Alexandrium_andersonii.AAC.1